MKIIEQIKIQNRANIVYAKRTLKNVLKKQSNESNSFLVFCLMELSTNLLKHADEGEIWILKDVEERIHLTALDNAKGIKNIAWAMENGTTQMKNSLGVGLFQMNNNEIYHVEIVSFTNKDLHGTIVLVSPRDFNPNICSLEIPYITEKISGDILIRKGRFLLLVDSSGHGKKAYTTSEYIKSYFYKHPFSCIMVEDFFSNIHTHLKENNLRGAVLSVLEISSSLIQSCGVGNISFWSKNEQGYRYVSQKDGVLGDIYSHSSKNSFQLAKDEKLIVATDGIDVGKMDKMLKKLPNNSSSLMIALCAMHFSSVLYDDKTIVIINQKDKKDERKF